MKRSWTSDELPISGARPPEVYYDYQHLDYSRLAPGGCTALRIFYLNIALRIGCEGVQMLEIFDWLLPFVLLC